MDLKIHLQKAEECLQKLKSDLQSIDNVGFSEYARSQLKLIDKLIENKKRFQSIIILDQKVRRLAQQEPELINSLPYYLQLKIKND